MRGKWEGGGEGREREGEEGGAEERARGKEREEGGLCDKEKGREGGGSEGASGKEG